MTGGTVTGQHLLPCASYPIYALTLMPFGASNAPSIFVSLMKSVFHNDLSPKSVAFLFARDHSLLQFVGRTQKKDVYQLWARLRKAELRVK